MCRKAGMENVLFMDGTYKVNAEEFVLYSILCEDGRAHGRPVCYAIVRSETANILRSLLKRFLETNPTVPSQCKVVVVDKDLTQLDIIKNLPSCKILLCTWHMLKYLHDRMRQEYDMGKAKREMLKRLIQRIIYARDPQ